MGNNKTNITGSKIQELGRKARTDKCGILELVNIEKIWYNKSYEIHK